MSRRTNSSSRKRTFLNRDEAANSNRKSRKEQQQCIPAIISALQSSMPISAFIVSLLLLLSGNNNNSSSDAFQQQRTSMYNNNNNNNNWRRHRTENSAYFALFSSRVEDDPSHNQPQQYWNPLRDSSSSTRTTKNISSNNNNNVAGRSRNKQKKKPLPVTGYDAKAIEKYYDMRPLQVGWRLNSLGLPLLAWYGRLLMDRATGVLDLPSVQRQRGKELREAFVRSNSVALIKSGQALSLRPDIIKNKIWAEELGKLVDAVGSFSDAQAMSIIRTQLNDIVPTMEASKDRKWKDSYEQRRGIAKTKLEKIVSNDPVLSLFEFENDYRAVASASIGQVYKAKLRRGPQLEAAIGKEMAAKWGGRYVAIKVQRPDVASSVSLDMYLLRRTATWLSKMRSGDILGIADQFGMQLFGELDYEREADNCLRFRDLYGKGWDDKIMVPDVCTSLTRKRVLVMEWVDGMKGPWDGEEGIETVRLGLKCSVDQLMTTGLFHADPHRGNLLRTPDGKLAFLDFGMMADIDEEDRYGLFGLCIGLQNKDLPLITENLLKVRRVIIYYLPTHGVVHCI
jgi:predicted unusual protein kinase regulating ubiquinone biosynthesis (AarF/ABC1/UbiB family)